MFFSDDLVTEDGSSDVCSPGNLFLDDPVNEQRSRPDLSGELLVPVVLVPEKRFIRSETGVMVAGCSPIPSGIENSLFHVLFLYVTIKREERHFQSHTKERSMIRPFIFFDWRGYGNTRHRLVGPATNHLQEPFK
ncbi:hypothetical protein ASZ90_015021 [hydrocarbon metagenome]|uniref:Uncharacterized protein n=1 Tax=hydrocarbon metagenome TaxID=938273 RepID=A0A0W8F380_9ZZZZ